MYYGPPNIDNLRRLDTEGLSTGDLIFFCPECFWQISGRSFAIPNHCPECKKEGLHTSKVDQELLDLRR